jgi:hypothetical protein
MIPYVSMYCSKPNSFLWRVEHTIVQDAVRTSVVEDQELSDEGSHAAAKGGAVTEMMLWREICVCCYSETPRYACPCRTVFYCGRRCQKRHWKQHWIHCQRSIVVHSLSGEEQVITCPRAGRVRGLRKRMETQLGKSRSTGHQLQFSLHGQLLEDAQLLLALDTDNGESITYVVRSVSAQSVPSLGDSDSD